MRQINLYNEFHLGDCLYTLHFCRKALKENKDINFVFFIESQYINKLTKHLNGFEDRLQLKDLKYKTEDAVNTWVGKNSFYYNRLNEFNAMFDLLFYNFFLYISAEIGIESPIKSNMDILMDNPLLLEKTPLSYDFDFLLGNSLPRSGQFEYKEDEWDELISYLKEKGCKVITTAPNRSGVPSVENYDLLQIGNLAIYAKNIISISTAPAVCMFNIYNIDKVQNWWVLSNHHICYSFNNRIKETSSVKNILKELQCIQQ